jgi:predicted aconitase
VPAVQLTDYDRAFLEGDSGAGGKIAMELLVAVAPSLGADSLLDISGAHIDGCLYHGIAGVDFATSLIDGDTKVRVPTTLNVSSLDLLHPELYRGDPGAASLSRHLMDAYLAMGCTPTWTCAPYQLATRPRLGEQVAWGESNAIVFANSVLGARTNRYGDFLDICCAITGRAPASGLHTDEGRLATLVLEVRIEDHMLDRELLYPLLGHVVGQVAGNEIPVIIGLDGRATEDRLKALGAAAASSGSVAMFHATGVTPEASTLEEALGGRNPVRTATVGPEKLAAAARALGRRQGRVGAVSVGTPHASLAEIEELARLVVGVTTRVPFYLNTGRDTLAEAESRGMLEALRGFGATLVTDTCTYITPIIGEVSGVVMTNSAKWAYYAPGNIGVEVALGSLEDCVRSAAAGTVVTEGIA